MSNKLPSKNLARRRFKDDEIKKQRVALVSLSLVLLIYALAGGGMKSQVTLLNLPIEFKRPLVLLWSAWVIWGYFLYRYVLVTSSPWSLFLEEVRLRAIGDKKVLALCRLALPRLEVPVEWRAQADRQISDGWSFAIVRRSGRYEFDPGQFYRPSTQASPSGGSGQLGYFPLTPSEVWTYRMALMRATLKAVALESTFSEVVLPYVLVWLTPIVWLVVYWEQILDFAI